MANWQDFENECTAYLNHQYGNYADFLNKGGADSTVPDIRVDTKKGSFYMEVKEPNAQSGQFVLLPNLELGIFEFSPQNKSYPNEFTDIITNYMNLDFHRFNSAGTAGQSLDIDKSIFYDWIEGYYINKGVNYFISKAQNYIVFPVEKFRNYFDVIAKYRIKRSGSSEPSRKYRASILNILSTDFGITKYNESGKKLFVFTHSNVNKIRFILGSYEYYLAEKEDGVYEVRQLSNTYNMNVIFSINLKSNQIQRDLQSFESELR